jgi:putative transcriptional regulator
MYHYKACGMPNVWLKNGFKIEKTPYGEGVTIEDVEGLHQAIGEIIVTRPEPLVGAEFRFLRQELELSQTALASLLGKDEQAVARWEKGAAKKVDPSAERLLRILYQQTTLGDKKLRPILEMLQNLERVPPVPMKYVATVKKKNWNAEAEEADISNC